MTKNSISWANLIVCATLSMLCIGCSGPKIGTTDTFEECCEFVSLHEGNEWTYSRINKLEGNSEQLIERVTPSKDSDSDTITINTTVSETGVEADEVLALTRGGVERREISGNILSPPMLIMEFPITSNGKWTTKPSMKTAFGNADFPTTGKYSTERVTVPAGTFDALVVTLDNMSGKYKTWFVRGVGKVKQIMKGPVIDTEIELLSYNFANLDTSGK